MTPLIRLDREIHYPEVMQDDEEESFAPNATHVTTRLGYPRNKAPEMNAQMYDGLCTAIPRELIGRRVTYSNEGAATRTPARQPVPVYLAHEEERTETRGQETPGAPVRGDEYRRSDSTTPSNYNTVLAEYHHYGPSASTQSRPSSGQMTLTNRQRAEDTDCDTMPGTIH